MPSGKRAFSSRDSIEGFPFKRISARLLSAQHCVELLTERNGMIAMHLDRDTGQQGSCFGWKQQLDTSSGDIVRLISSVVYQFT